MAYAANLKDIRFALHDVLGIERLAETDVFAEANRELIDQVLEEAGRFTDGVIAPLNTQGDRQGSKLIDGKVVTPDGWADAYRQFVDGGWNGVSAPVEFGGMGLPTAVSTAVTELMTAANTAFGLCPLLTQGAIHALELHGSDELKEIYLGKLVSGEWAGTMNLTEPHAGSDVGALTTKAVPVGDGSYKISGTKIFITYGEHEMAENIIHLVLARLPEAPIGTRGISLFVVPKYLVNEDGSIGERNAVTCLKVEEKLGIHASPTCVMSYDGAVGYLVGQENRGMAHMFTMMNDARLAIGIQGVALIERAFQHAAAYATERRQGKPFGKQHDQKEMVPIINHPDVRRMLFEMRATAQAARALCYDTALAADLARALPDEAARAAAQARVDLLTPIAKAWPTEMAVTMASLGIQVHGGMGFIEETGAAQFMRDARITPIYEGTTGIQAIDLVVRKLPMNGGEVVAGFLAEIDETANAARATNDPEFVAIADRLASANAALGRATRWMLEKLAAGAADDALAGATPYCMMFGAVAGGYYLTRGALAARGQDADAADRARRIASARFFAESTLAVSEGYEVPATRGAADLMDGELELLAS